MVSEIPSEIQTVLQRELGPQILDFRFITGGCINQAGRLTTTKGEFFLKWNSVERFPQMFVTEARGLELLEKTRAIRVPSKIFCHDDGRFQFLVLELIKSVNRKYDFWKNFGESLARLHLNTSTSFGLDHDNYIGSLHQENNPNSNWCEFFTEKRLQHQILIGIQDGLIGRVTVQAFERLYQKIPDIIPTGSPALIHGDLWSGNLITDDAGNPCLIDPAVYYGSGEVDLAMSQLFGGFDDSFLDAYTNVCSLPAGYQERMEIYKLYYLLVHVNLFGASYLSQVTAILKKFE